MNLDAGTPAAGPGSGSRSPFRSNLTRRVATAAVILPPLAAGLLAGPPLLGLAIAGGVVALGLYEFFRLLEARQLVPFKVTGWVLATVLFVEVSHPARAWPPLWPLAAVLLLASVLRRSEDLAGALPAAAFTLLGAIYLGGLGGTIAGLRVADPEAGSWRIVLMLTILMMADTFAFFMGRWAGRRPLAPTISPGKTVEGALGGLVGGAAGALAVRAIGLPQIPLVDAVVLGVVAAALGIVGDLVESALKRWAGVKDSGSSIPGHGGALDRLDSVLFGSPVLYYYFLFAH